METEFFKSTMGTWYQMVNIQEKKENNKLKREYNWVWSRQGQINMHIPKIGVYILQTKMK